MLRLSNILSYYPAGLQNFPRFILREYLQAKILQIIFDSKYASKFCFIGGTCLRILHENNRFSEDLDFDNFSLDLATFQDLSEIIKVRLEQEALAVEIRVVSKNAYHCYVKVPEVLFAEGLATHREEKILLQTDTQSQGFSFIPNSILLNRFDVFTEVFSAPLDILLSQKIFAILNRKRNKGRDFYDAVFLFSKTEPNMDFLKFKLGVKTMKEVKERLLEHCTTIDMLQMAEDVKPFLFNPKEETRVIKFKEFIKSRIQ